MLGDDVTNVEELQTEQQLLEHLGSTAIASNVPDGGTRLDANQNDNLLFKHAETKAADSESPEQPLEPAAGTCDLAHADEVSPSAGSRPIRSAAERSADCSASRTGPSAAQAHSPPGAALHCDGGVSVSASANINSSSVHSNCDDKHPQCDLEGHCDGSIRTGAACTEDTADHWLRHPPNWHQPQEIVGTGGSLEVMHPQRGSFTLPLGGSDAAQQSLWYRNMYRKLHGRPNEGWFALP